MEVYSAASSKSRSGRVQQLACNVDRYERRWSGGHRESCPDTARAKRKQAPSGPALPTSVPAVHARFLLPPPACLDVVDDPQRKWHVAQPAQPQHSVHVDQRANQVPLGGFKRRACQG